MSSKQETLGTLRRLQARWGDKPIPFFDLSTSLEEHVMLYAQLLGAEDPYQAVLHPDMLERVLTNTLPDWVLPSGIPPLEIEGSPEDGP